MPLLEAEVIVGVETPDRCLEWLCEDSGSAITKLKCRKLGNDVAATLIRPADEGLLEAREVGTAVNRVANDSEALIAPFSPAAAEQQAVPPMKKAKPKKPKAPDDQASLF